MRALRGLLTIACLPIALGMGAKSASATEVQNICRLKGQEPIRLHGQGLVTGLSGTGDTRFLPLHNVVAQAMGVFGSRVANLRELENLKNVALVWVTCEISPTGGREGDRYDCVVTSIATARSLEGGRLIGAALTGPNIKDPTVYALASGDVSLPNERSLNNGRVSGGAALIQDLPAPFIKCNDRITLVIDSAHATFVTANEIATRINDRFAEQTSVDGRSPVQLARALDAKNIEVFLPPFARSDLVRFVADVMETRLDRNVIHTEARVIVNERSGTITLTGEVELKPVQIAQRNLIIFPANRPIPPELAVGLPIPNNMVALAQTQPPYPNNPELANLADLLTAMNQAQVPLADRIAIIKELAKSGKLHAKVLFE